MTSLTEVPGEPSSAVTGPGAGQAVLEVEAQDPDHACSSSKVRLTEFIQ